MTSVRDRARALDRADEQKAAPRRVPIERLPQPDAGHLHATWRHADPARIAAALGAALARNPGGWYVVGQSADVPRAESVTRVVAGREVVLWRTADGTLAAGPGACPHLGALLDRCPVVAGAVRCRWHGLALPATGTRTWTPFATYDDGVLVWVRLPTPDETPTDAPVLAVRPPTADAVAAVIDVVGVCEPEDVIANRLDPWHGSWFHPYAFSHLVVDDAASDESRLVVDVAFRLTRTWGVPVRAEFACPDARTIVMTITGGEGAGSVVETHATPLGPGPDGRPRTRMTEATLAYSDRRGFRAARALAPLVRAGMRRSARQLWVDDLAYAERRYALRARGDYPG